MIKIGREIYINKERNCMVICITMLEINNVVCDDNKLII